MKPLRVACIQRGCVYDGPGVRTTVFLKGCPLRCPWCCNPETQSYDEEYFIDNKKCIFYQGVHSDLCNNCERKEGSRSILECPYSVAEKASVDYCVGDLMEKFMRDVPLFNETNGGVTFSGGEPFFQAESLKPLIKLLAAKNVSVALETSLVTTQVNFRLLYQYVQYWIVDLKLQPILFLDNEDYLKNLINKLNQLDSNRICYRLVFVDDLILSQNRVLSNLERIGVGELELLLCHNLGQTKYQRLSISNKDYSADSQKMKAFQLFLERNGIKVKTLAV